MQSRKTEIWVGLFMLVVLCSALFICLRAADLSSLRSQPTYQLHATFDNIGGLKVRSPVKVGGVVIGRVSEITLDTERYLPRVVMSIETRYNKIPSTSSLSIRTSGLLGEQFLALNIGFIGKDDAENDDLGVYLLKDGGEIQDTKPAMVLEDLIGQFLYKSDGADTTPSANSDASAK